MTTLVDVLRWISLEATTEELNRLTPVINDRRKTMRKVEDSLNAALLNVGDEVTIGKCSPKYLVGEKGKVIKIDGTKVSVDVGRYIGRYGPIITGPANIFIKVA